MLRVGAEHLPDQHVHALLPWSDTWAADKIKEAQAAPSHLGVPTIMENQMEKKMENEMETGFIYGIMGIWGFPKLGGCHIGVPIIRTIVYWGLFWGPPILGNYHITFCYLRLLEV